MSSSGIQGNNYDSGTPRLSISADGRFAAFSSQALDLVANDTNGFTDVFLRELGDAPPQQRDCMAPTTTASASTASGAAYAPGTWTKEDVEVSLSAQDNDGGSGIKEIAYSINGGANQTYNPTNKIPVTTEGSKTISYFATDNAGNAETARTFTVKLDKTAPQVTPGDVVSNDWRSGPLSQQFTASDGRSGLANAADANFTLTASRESVSSTPSLRWSRGPSRTWPATPRRARCRP